MAIANARTTAWKPIALIRSALARLAMPGNPRGEWFPVLALRRTEVPMESGDREHRPSKPPAPATEGPVTRPKPRAALIHARSLHRSPP
jgi:hypothetical protein